MVALRNNKIVSIPIESIIVGKPHNVDVQDELVLDARSIGVCFGDELEHIFFIHHIY